MNETRLLRVDAPGWLADVTAVLEHGGLVAFPTDTVYGVGAMASDPVAVAGLYRAKGRREDQPVPVLVAGEGDLDRLGINIPPGARRLAHAFWPGPLTLVVLKRPGLPNEVSPGPTVGLRAPDHPVALEILRAAGPVATSSANRSGEPPAILPAQVRESLGGRIELLLDAGPAPGGRPSTVVDCTVDPPAILREGPVTIEAILRAWRG